MGQLAGDRAGSEKSSFARPLEHAEQGRGHRRAADSRELVRIRPGATRLAAGGLHPRIR
jgi:hypothetical protein